MYAKISIIARELLTLQSTPQVQSLLREFVSVGSFFILSILAIFFIWAAFLTVIAYRCAHKVSRFLGGSYSGGWTSRIRHIPRCSCMEPPNAFSKPTRSFYHAPNGPHNCEMCMLEWHFDGRPRSDHVFVFPKVATSSQRKFLQILRGFLRHTVVRLFCRIMNIEKLLRDVSRWCFESRSTVSHSWTATDFLRKFFCVFINRKDSLLR